MKSKIIIATISALLFLLSFITHVVANEYDRITFQGKAEGQGFMAWGMSAYPGYIFGDPFDPEFYSAEFNGKFMVVGTGFAEESDFVHPGGGCPTCEGEPTIIGAWHVTDIQASTSLKGGWEEVTNTGEIIPHTVKIDFNITGETDFIYQKWISAVSNDNYQTCHWTEMNILNVGINLDWYSPPPWFPPQWPPVIETWDPQYATMVFNGILDGVEIGGLANILLYASPELSWAKTFFVNLQIDQPIGDPIYAGFFWNTAQPQPDNAAVRLHVQ